MAKRTQKSGATARFGARYGVSVRRRAGAALIKKSKNYTCPVCQYQKVTRKVAGIWECKKCRPKKYDNTCSACRGVTFSTICRIT